MIGVGLSVGTLKPVGKVALSELDLASNATWMTLFVILHGMSLAWGVVSMLFKFRLIKGRLERKPVLFRFYFLISGTLMILTNIIFGIVSVLNLSPR